MKRHYLPLIAWFALALPAPAQVVLTPRAQLFQADHAAWIGVSVLDVTEERVKELKLKDEHGVEVITVAFDSPARKAGIKEHDVILEYNGARLEGVDQFKRMVTETPVGRTVKLVISRDGVTQTVSVKLEERTGLRRGPEGNQWAFKMPAPPTQPPSPPRPPRALIPNWNGNIDDLFQGFGWGDSPRLGIEGEEITGQLGEYFGVPEKTGVLVRDVSAGSAAEHAGLKAGDVITKVNGKRVQDMDDLHEALRDNAGKSFPVTIVRNKKETTLTVTVEKVENRRGNHV